MQYLAVVAEHVHAHNGLAKGRHIGLDNIIVNVLLVAKSIQALQAWWKGSDGSQQQGQQAHTHSCFSTKLSEQDA